MIYANSNNLDSVRGFNTQHKSEYGGALCQNATSLAIKKIVDISGNLPINQQNKMSQNEKSKQLKTNCLLLLKLRFER